MKKKEVQIFPAFFLTESFKKRAYLVAIFFLFLTFLTQELLFSENSQTPSNLQTSSKVPAKSAITIHSIHLKGNTVIPRTNIIRAIRYEAGDEFSYKNFNNNLKNVLELYKKEGYLFTKILPVEIKPLPDDRKINIEVTIEEGEKVVVSQIGFRGNQYFSRKKLLDIIQIRKGQTFSEKKINSSLEKIAEAYSQKGYPFCQVSVDTIAIQDSSYNLHLDFEIAEGKLVRISHLKFEGNEITKDKTLKLLLNFPKNTIYNQTNIELARKNLLSKQYIQSANIKPINSDLILVRIKERSMNHLNGVLGLTSTNEGQSLNDRLSGFIDFDFMNINGTDREIHVLWKKLQNSSTIFNISYTEPFLLGKQISAQGKLSRKTVDTTYVNTEFKLNTRYLLPNYNKIGINYLNSISLLDTIRTNQQGIGLDFEMNRFDYPPNPYSGYDIYLGSEIIWKTKQSYKQRLSLDADYSLPLSQKTTFFLKGVAKLQFTFNDSLNTYELFQFGGYDNLRGFVDNQFISEKFGVLVFEYRFLLSKESRIFLFCDSAICEEYKNLFGVGFGVRLNSKIGLLKIDYGIGHQNETWTNPLQGIIHFGFETSF